MEKATRNYKPFITILTIVLITAIVVLLRLPGYKDFDAFDVTILPLINAILNVLTFVFLICALFAILKRKIQVHKSFIIAALVCTVLFLLNYVFFHTIASATPFGGSGGIKILYYFVLVSHITLAMVTIPMALTSITSTWNKDFKLHRKVSRWTMPIWLYVSLTGVIVYLLIRPYY
ncbi:MAG TPA: DUF420 domain-containing protein [Sporosarcina sp.]|nr:DUF420 domain-containing protein [Sporosarcina sp.]